jgi:serine/threonine protein phosphatase PrpC
MRITPTREQMTYLASIGVSEDRLAQSVPSPVATEVGDHVQPDGRSGHGAAWVLILFVAAVLFLFACIRLARGEEQAPSPPAQRVTNAKPVTPDSKERSAAGRRRGDCPASSVEGHQEGASPGDIGGHPAGAARKSVGAPLPSPGERADGTGQPLRPGRDGTTAEDRVLPGDGLQVEDGQALRGALPLVAILALFTVLILVERWAMRKRLNQVEAAVLGRTPENPGGNGAEPQRRESKEEAMIGPLAPCSVGVRPARPAAAPIPSPREQMDVMIAAVAKLRRHRVRLRHPEGPWAAGLATAKGNVRTENQDYGLCFQLDDDHDVLIVADGCGGIPYGRRAAYVATVTAAASVVQTYRKAPLLFTPHAQDAAAQAIKDAAHRLAVEGDKLNVTESRDGLRTTLIVLVGNRREVAYAYIGDGGGCVVRASGAVESFLTPQKASPLALNVLAASLGPSIEGEFVTGTIKRMAGDLVIVGTDGVFDRVGPEFPKDVLRGCIQFGGDLQATADRVVEELAAFKDAGGHVCDDNMTLALMGDGTAPHLARGFWSTSPAQDARPDPASGAVEPTKETGG